MSFLLRERFRKASDWVTARLMHHRMSSLQSAETEYQIANFISGAACETVRGIKYLFRRFPGKTCGAVSIVGSFGIAAQGLSSGDASIATAGLVLVGSNLALILAADRRSSLHRDPQDKKFKPINLIDPWNHPHEVSASVEMVALPLLIYGGLNDAGGGQIGHLVMGATDIPAWAISSFVRERPVANDHKYSFAPLNLPGVRQAAQFTQRRPLMAAAPIYFGGDAGLFGYELYKAGFDFSRVDAEYFTSFISYTIATAFFAFAFKRRQPANDNQALPTPRPPTTLSSPPLEPLDLKA